MEPPSPLKMPEPAKAVPTRDAAHLLFLGVAGATPVYRAHVHREAEARRAKQQQEQLDEEEIRAEAEAARIRGVAFDEAECREERMAERRRAAVSEGRMLMYEE